MDSVILSHDNTTIKLIQMDPVQVTNNCNISDSFQVSKLSLEAESIVPFPQVQEFGEEEIGWLYYQDEWRILQPFWKLAFVLIGRSGIESPLSIACIPVAFYFAMVLFFTVCDIYGTHWHWIQKYKIQSHKVTFHKVFNSIM